ncbi:hypothetical protein ACFQY0_12800 [Haloferula chungangensis]|uniref:Glycosyltransferase n=1 Tax=Haloferula chungangensis TaxID=1048331 RepID=A0ABW2L8J7_9BACT
MSDLKLHSPDCILANECEALFIAAEYKSKVNDRVKIIFDAHEYYTDSHRSIKSRLLGARPADALFRNVLKLASARTTVCAELATRYFEEYGHRFGVVRNIPIHSKQCLALPDRDSNDKCDGVIRLIHHGVASRSRRIDDMIRIIANTDIRYTLDLMLVSDQQYQEELRRLAMEIAPGRITFVDPVKTVEIVETIRRYDGGLFLIPPFSFNAEMCLPNKLFEFIHAGLAVFIGPSPAMADLVRSHRCGFVAKSYDFMDMVDLLNSTSRSQIQSAQAMSQKASGLMSGENEMDKALELWCSGGLRIVSDAGGEFTRGCG